jgi:hypothetical protein
LRLHARVQTALAKFWSVLACGQTDRPLRASTVFAWQATVAFVAHSVVRAVAAETLDYAEVINGIELIPYPGPGCVRSKKITNTDVLGTWDEAQKLTLETKCESLWPLWILVTLMIRGFIRIDGRLVFQDKEHYGSAWIVMFKLLGQWNKGIGQSQPAKEYIFANLPDVLKFAFISPEEAKIKEAFASCTVPLNLPKPCNPLPPAMF